uniref:DDE-1 domain-containing protein n=1 Tax=Trichogramma kaykai TaxID=54128 RepID=A0ABD2XFZ9_9HYME
MHDYSLDDLEEAIERVNNRESYGKTAAEFKIPKSTLYAKANDLVPVDAKRGPSTVLSEEEENRLEKWILDKARLGFPMHEEEVKTAVQNIVNDLERPNYFTTDNKPEALTKTRASVTEAKLREWFKEVYTYFTEHKLEHVLDRPESIFNGDESGFCLCPKSSRLLGPRKEKNFYEISAGNEKENITVLCSFSAAGATLPPMIMFSYQRIPAHLTQAIPPDWAIGRSDSGWMVSSTFYEYIANVFYPWCVKNEVPFPVVYFLDGHKSHLSLELSGFCREKSIILISLFPNSTHIIQPCDVAIFRAVKIKWREQIQSYKQQTHVPLTRANFAPLLKNALDTLSVETIKNGFKKCGLYPFEPDAPDYSQCISNQREQIKKRNSCEREKSVLNYNDYVSTKRFFDNFIKKDKLENFIEMRNTNKLCSDQTYLLWKKCIDNMELFEPEDNESGLTNETVQFNSSDHSSDSLMDESTRDTSPSISQFSSYTAGSMQMLSDESIISASNIMKIPVINVESCDVISVCEVLPTINIENVVAGSKKNNVLLQKHSNIISIEEHRGENLIYETPENSHDFDSSIMSENQRKKYN